MDNGPSRRNIILGAGSGAIAALGNTAFGQTPNATASAQHAGLIDPTSEYPRPPFAKQQQQWPGLAGKMSPPPDHGEESYRGSGRLLGRKALITGGDSGMGRGAAIAYAREGADVALSYFSTEEPDAKQVMELIKAEGRVGIAIPGDLREEAFCKKLVKKAV